MTRRPQPRYPPAARRLNKQADVQLRLLVDENGDVARIERVGDSFGFGFEEAAEAAARKTEWVAATKLGVRVKMWVDLKISFRP
jgi:TonB family protein